MKYLTTFILLAIISASTSWASDSAEDTLRLFWKHIAESKHEQAYAYLFPIANQERLAIKKKNLQDASKAIQSGALQVNVLGSKEGKDWALVIVKYNDSVQYVPMALHESKWRFLSKEDMGATSLKDYPEEELISLQKWWWNNRDTFRKKHQ